MFELEVTTKFKKDLKKIKGDNKKFEKVAKVLELLQYDGFRSIPKKMVPHQLKGKYKGNWECHIMPDLLIIWFQVESPNVIKLIRVGSHSDLFK